MLEKIAFLSPQKKISIKWILYLVDEVDEDEELHRSRILTRICILVNIYLKYDYLFIDDVDSIEWKRELTRLHNRLLSISDFSSLYPRIIIR
uniref:Uncharacterized protein n=1 Tax=Pithovirus LCPAC403 TaxID=2506596 RepID=A0A481ZFF9_9VIRU|nr:MAG: hypothetical protein LCPAC403_03550 [Pithovirus LCPAC403]